MAPGTGGFLTDVLGKVSERLHFSANISFSIVIAVCAWIVAILLLVGTKGNLGYLAEPRDCP